MCCRNGQLTPQEWRVARLLAEGQRHGEIARRLTISRNTAYTHVRNVRSKLGVRSTLEAVARLANELLDARR